MNALDSLPMATGAAWLTWQPVTPAECMRLALGVAALTLAAWGLWQMRIASAARNRQLDAQTESLASLTRMLDERTAALMRSLETVIERTKGN